MGFQIGRTENNESIADHIREILASSHDGTRTVGDVIDILRHTYRWRLPNRSDCESLFAKAGFTVEMVSRKTSEVNPQSVAHGSYFYRVSL